MEAIRLEPDFAYAHYLLGHALAAQGQTAAADRELDEALRIEPEEPCYYAHRAAVSLARDDWWLAKTWSERGLALNPEYLPCRETLIQALFELELFDVAEQHVKQLLNLDPEQAEAHRRKGWLDFRKNKTGRAIEAFQYSAAQEPHRGDRVKVFERLTRPSENHLIAALKRIPHVLHLPYPLQLSLIVLPTVAYLAMLTFQSDSKPLFIACAAWAALTIAIFGIAYMLLAVLSDLVLTHLNPDKARVEQGLWPNRGRSARILGWALIAIIFGLPLAYIYLFLVLSPFFLPHIAAAILLSITCVVTYRALRAHLIRRAYWSNPQSGLLFRFVSALKDVDKRMLIAFSLGCGIVAAASGIANREKKSPPPRPWENQSRKNDIQIDYSTGEAIMPDGKRAKIGPAAQKLFGIEPKNPPAQQPQRDESQ